MPAPVQNIPRISTEILTTEADIRRQRALISNLKDIDAINNRLINEGFICQFMDLMTAVRNNEISFVTDRLETVYNDQQGVDEEFEEEVLLNLRIFVSNFKMILNTIVDSVFCDDLNLQQLTFGQGIDLEASHVRSPQGLPLKQINSRPIPMEQPHKPLSKPVQKTDWNPTINSKPNLSKKYNPVQPEKSTKYLARKEKSIKDERKPAVPRMKSRETKVVSQTMTKKTISEPVSKDAKQSLPQQALIFESQEHQKTLENEPIQGRDLSPELEFCELSHPDPKIVDVDFTEVAQTSEEQPFEDRILDEQDKPLSSIEEKQPASRDSSIRKKVTTSLKRKLLGTTPPLDSEFLLDDKEGPTIHPHDKKGLQFPQSETPGPGEYNTQKAFLSTVEPVAKNVIFTREEKKSSFDEIPNKDNPGPIYNPVVHFVILAKSDL